MTTTTTRGALNTLQTILLSHEKHDFCTSMSRIHWKIVNCHSSLALFTSDTTSIWGFCCHSSHQHLSLQRHVINFYDDEMEINPQAMGNTNTFNNAWSNSSLPHSWDFVLLNEREGGRNPIFEYFVYIFKSISKESIDIVKWLITHGEIYTGTKFRRKHKTA